MWRGTDWWIWQIRRGNNDSATFSQSFISVHKKKTELFVFSRNVSDPIKNQIFRNWVDFYEKNITKKISRRVCEKFRLSSLNRKSINCLWKSRDFWHKHATHQKSLLCDSVESSQSEAACKFESFLKIWLVIFDMKKSAAKEDSAVWECRIISYGAVEQ